MHVAIWGSDSHGRGGVQCRGGRRVGGRELFGGGGCFSGGMELIELSGVNKFNRLV